MNVFIVLVLFAGVAALDGRSLWKKERWGMRGLYLALLLPSFVVLLLYGAKVPLPAPGAGILQALIAMLPFISPS